MALYFLETSALVKLYVIELGTDYMLRLAADSAENRLAILPLSSVEVRSAIRRRERAGDVDPRSASFILDRLRVHIETRFLMQPLTQAILDGALEIIDRYALRAYDAVQLAGCLALQGASGREAPVFVCSDQQLLDAARSELLAVLDPRGAV